MKPEDICFVDEMVYPPAAQAEPPYALTIESSLPLLGDRVGTPRCIGHAQLPSWSHRASCILHVYSSRVQGPLLPYR